MKENTSKRVFIKKSLTGIAGCLVYGGAERALFAATEGLSQDALWKWSKEAMFYTQTARGPKCDLCPSHCFIKPGGEGECRNRVNHNNKIYSIAYGNPCAVHNDPVEKKPLYHFLPGSSTYSIAAAGCNLACLNCQNWNMSQKSPRQTRNYDLMPDKVVEGAIAAGSTSISYTYTEPITFYEYTYDTSVLARKKKLRNILVTAGYINENPLRALCKVIDAVNIDLKSFDNTIYQQLNGGSLAPVLRSLRIFHEENVWIEITNLLVPQWTDKPDMIKRMCEWLCNNGLQDYPLHFSRFYPQYKLSHLPVTPVSIMQKAREIALDAGIRHVYIGNVPELDTNNTICPVCKKTVVERKGLRTLAMHITKGKCTHCGTMVPGIWQ